jgi:AcrR family transcriptional regulator
MEKIPHSHLEETRKTRADGAQSRERLLLAAMRLFAEQGFAKTSTREIALAAGTNIASISYYFGDKAGLYRAAFTEPAPHPKEDVASFTDPALTCANRCRVLHDAARAPQAGRPGAPVHAPVVPRNARADRPVARGNRQRHPPGARGLMRCWAATSRCANRATTSRGSVFAWSAWRCS